MALTKISTGGFKDDAANQAKIADEAIDEARLQVSNAGTNGQFLQKQSGDTGGLTWATVTVPDSDKIEEGNTSIETVDTGSDGHVKITTEGTERVRVIADGNVGIGTTDPQFTVDVNGELASKNASKEFIGLQLTNNEARIRSSFYSGASGAYKPITFFTSDTERMRIHSGGQISKGTTVAREQVHFHYDSSDENYLRFTNSTTGTASGDGFNVGISSSEQAIIWHKESEAMLFGTADTERFRIDTAGQLGIAGANYGTSGQVLTSQGASSAPQWADATSAAMGYDLWCVTADFGYYREWNKTHALGSAQTFTNDGGSGDASGGPGPATMSISRCTTSQNPFFVKVGTGMSMSNGVWTFPNTGEWRVTFAPQMTSGNTGGEATQNMFIYTTSNNGTDWHSTYKRRGRSGRYTYRSITAGPLIARFKITDTSNQKVKFGVGDGDVRLKMEGATDMVESHFVFEQIS